MPWPTRCWGSGTYLYPSKAGMLRLKKHKVETEILPKWPWLGLNICSLNVMRGKESNKNTLLTYMQQLDSNKNLKFTWEPKNGCRPGSTIFQLPWSKIIAAVLSSVYCILYHNPAVEKTWNHFNQFQLLDHFCLGFQYTCEYYSIVWPLTKPTKPGLKIFSALPAAHALVESFNHCRLAICFDVIQNSGPVIFLFHSHMCDGKQSKLTENCLILLFKGL